MAVELHPGRPQRLLTEAGPGALRLWLAVVTGLAIALAPATAAQAAPKDCGADGANCTLAELEAQIRDDWLRLEPVIEKHNAATIELADNRARVAELDRELAPLRQQVDAAMNQVTALSVAAYRHDSRGSRVGAVLDSGSVDGYMQGLQLLDGVAVKQQALVADTLRLKTELEAKQAPYVDLVARLTLQEAELAAQEASIRAGVDELNVLRRKADGGGARTGSPRPAPCPYSYDGSPGSEAAKIACQQIGRPYVWNTGENGGTFDCSGLMLYAWNRATGGRTKLLHYTGWQYRDTRRVSRAELRPGDLVFYYAGNSHVGMVTGGGWIVHAAGVGLGVRMDRIDHAPIYGYGRPI